MMTIKPAILSLSGLDSSGGSGLMLEKRVTQNLDATFFPIITCLASQTDCEFNNLTPSNAKEVLSQIELLKPYDVHVIKIGALGFYERWPDIMGQLQTFNLPIILDPVIETSSGGRLIKERDPRKIEALYTQHLIPKASLVTPNTREARFLLNIDENISSQILSQKFYERFQCDFLLKGGHNPQAQDALTDILCVSGKMETYHHHRFEGTFRGTGCALSIALAYHYAHEKNWFSACQKAINSLQEWLKGAKPFQTRARHILI